MKLRIKVKNSIGLKRIPSITPKTTADATRNMQKQLKAITDNVYKIIANIEHVTAPALAEAMRPIFIRSQQLVPKDTRRLMRSGFFSVGTFRNLPAVNIGYAAGDNPPYAIIVHERMDTAHKAGTQAKFLEQPFKRQLPLIPQRVARAIKRDAGLS